MLPTHPMALLWVTQGGWNTNAPAPTFKKTCPTCRYELIEGWCSRCDLEAVERSTSARFLHLGPIVVCWTK